VIKNSDAISKSTVENVHYDTNKQSKTFLGGIVTYSMVIFIVFITYLKTISIKNR